MNWTEHIRDAAFAGNIDTADWHRAVAGYYGGPGAFHVWSKADWDRFPRHRKLPIWVAAQGDKNGTEDGKAAVEALRALKVPPRAYTALDLETMVDKTYVEHFGDVLADAGYKTWVYGSASSVFQNPVLDGFWVASYMGIGPFMVSHEHVRATQYQPGEQFDSSTVHRWTYELGTWWR
jgi:hypothetical protein